jgi:DNA-binding response OmpR family regulator
VIRVLHVDDEAPIRLLARVNLEAEGMEVIEAANGRTGVQLAKREQPDLILLGVMMPVLDGWQAAEELGKDPETREIPIVFLTAQSELRHRARAFDLGAVDYITKPFNPVELAARLRGVMERIGRGERDELRREKISELRALSGRGTTSTDASKTGPTNAGMSCLSSVDQ